MVVIQFSFRDYLLLPKAHPAHHADGVTQFPSNTMESARSDTRTTVGHRGAPAMPTGGRGDKVKHTHLPAPRRGCTGTLQTEEREAVTTGSRAVGAHFTPAAGGTGAPCSGVHQPHTQAALSVLGQPTLRLSKCHCRETALANTSCVTFQ